MNMFDQVRRSNCFYGAIKYYCVMTKGCRRKKLSMLLLTPKQK